VKVIQHVREKFSCRSCETITQPPAPSHPISRGRAGPGLLAHLLFAKYGLHLPLNVYARDGIDLDVSTLADWVEGPATARPEVFSRRRRSKRRGTRLSWLPVGRNHFIAPSASPSGAIKRLRPTRAPRTVDR
jgi:transposase